MIVIASHSGSFHADDACGTAILAALHENRVRIVRSRDPQIIESATFAVDVGGQWDPENGRFDHHQKGFDGKRESGVVYASAGLVWRQHGIAYLRKLLPSLTSKEAVDLQYRVDEELIQHLDMADTGAAVGAPGRFGLSALIDSFNVTREEQAANPRSGEVEPGDAQEYVDRAFWSAVQTMQLLLARVCAHAYNALRSEKIVLAAERLLEGQILVLPSAGLDWIPVVCEHLPEVLFVIYPDSADQQFQVRTVPVEPQSFEARLDLPEQWAGLRDDALSDVSGVTDAVFCHNARFICGAESKAGAITMATLALRQGKPG